MTTATLRLDAHNSVKVAEGDLDDVCRFQWFELNGYAARRQQTPDGRHVLILMHRQIMRAMPGELVDHEDGDGLNNDRLNLRIATASQNGANKPSPRATGYRGVYYEPRSGRFRAQIKIHGKNKYLGTFDTPEGAALCYDRAALVTWGRFARLNFPQLAGDCLQQLPLPYLEPDPFDTPAPATKADWYEISYLRRVNRWQPHSAGIAELEALTRDLDIPF